MKKMKVVYIAHPVAGDKRTNIRKIVDLVRGINLLSDDIVPSVPYLADLFALDDKSPMERERGIKNSIAVLTAGHISELWLFGPEISSGMRLEIEAALTYGIPVWVMDRETVIPDDLKEVVKHGIMA